MVRAGECAHIAAAAAAAVFTRHGHTRGVRLMACSRSMGAALSLQQRTQPRGVVSAAAPTPLTRACPARPRDLPPRGHAAWGSRPPPPPAAAAASASAAPDGPSQPQQPSLPLDEQQLSDAGGALAAMQWQQLAAVQRQVELLTQLYSESQAQNAALVKQNAALAKQLADATRQLQTQQQPQPQLQTQQQPQQQQWLPHRLPPRPVPLPTAAPIPPAPRPMPPRPIQQPPPMLRLLQLSELPPRPEPLSPHQPPTPHPLWGTRVPVGAAGEAVRAPAEPPPAVPPAAPAAAGAAAAAAAAAAAGAAPTAQAPQPATPGEKLAPGAAAAAAKVLLSGLRAAAAQPDGPLDAEQLVAAAGAVSAHAAGGGSVEQLLTPPKLAELLALAAWVPQALQVAGMPSLLQLAAARIQSPSAPALTPAEGVSTVVALTQLQLQMEPAWLAALTKQLNGAAATDGKAWFKSVRQVAAYLQALHSLQQQLPLQQLQVLCSYATGGTRLQDAPVPDLLALVELLVAQLQRHTATSTSPQAVTQYSGLVRRLCIAALVPLVSAAVELSGRQALSIAACMAALDICPAELLPTSKGAAASKGGADVSWCSAVLEAAAAHVAAASVSGTLPADDLLVCLRLSSTLPATAVSQDCKRQLLALLQQHVTQQQQQPFAPAKAAQLFCAAASLALANDASLHTVDGVPGPQLGGVLVQLLQDAEADWSSVGGAELARLPALSRAVKLPLGGAAAYLAAVQQEMALLGAAGPDAVMRASQQARGPVELLSSACWLVMDYQPGQAGDTTLSGLAQHVSSDEANSSSSSSSADEGRLQVPLALFAAAAAALQPAGVVERLSSSQAADLVHAFTAAGLWQELLSADAQRTVWQLLLRPDALSGLTPPQHVALLVVAHEQRASEGEAENSTVSWQLLRAVLQASEPHLSAWPPSCLAFALSSLGNTLGDTPDFPPASLAAGVLRWRAAALGLLGPHVQALVPDSLVQLLLGCNRIRMVCHAAAAPRAADAPASSIPVDEPGVVVVLAAAITAVSQVVDQLSPPQIVQLVMGCSKQDAAGVDLGQRLLGRLQPALGSMSLSAMGGLLQGLARWPTERRPRPSHEWMGAFFTATGSFLAAAANAATARVQRVSGDGSALSDVRPGVLVDLTFCLAMLGWLPPRSWQDQLYIVAAAALPEFTPSDAASLLQAMAIWRQAVRLGRSADGQPMLSSSDTSSLDMQQVSYPAPLVDGLVYLLAAGRGVAQLSETAALTLPASLQALGWPPDAQLVGGIVASYRRVQAEVQTQQGTLRASIADAEAALQRYSAAKHAKRRSQLQQQLGKRQHELAALAGGVQVLEQLVGAWEQLLQTKQAAGEAAVSSGGGSFDVDSLMGGMLAAAGLEGAADEQQAADILDAEFEEVA